MASLDDIFNGKEDSINKAYDALDKLITKLSKKLLNKLIEDIADKLNVKDGNLENNANNYKILAAIDEAYEEFAKENNKTIAKEIFTNVKQISGFNIDYFGKIAANAKDYLATVQDVTKIIHQRLGLDVEGNNITLKKGGYMDSLLKDNAVKTLIKDYSLKEVTNRTGFKSFKQGLEEIIVGNDEKLGGFKQHYKTYAYDVFTTVDRMEGELIAIDLKLDSFIFGGTIIDTSREFCKDHVGKVYTTDEAEKWRELIGKYKIVQGAKAGTTKKVPIGPIVENAEKYNPIIDMGGIGCRHIPRWISKEVADKLKQK